MDGSIEVLKPVTPPEYDAWKARGTALSCETRILQFAIADWLVEGCDLCAGNATAVYDLAEKLWPNYARQTFLSWVTVAKRFPASIRIESEFLTFGHYQLAQSHLANCSALPDGVMELGWLRQADERKMSISVLRSAMENAFELRQQATLDAARNTDPASEPEPVKPQPKKAYFPGEEYTEKENNRLLACLPQRTRWAVKELAKIRRLQPAFLIVRAVQDFVDAHADELGSSIAAEEKRMEEFKAATAAAQVIEYEKRARASAHDEARKALRKVMGEAEARLAPLRDTQQMEELRAWCQEEPFHTPAEFEERLASILADVARRDAEIMAVFNSEEPAN
jgi:hypothetical protein